MHEKQANSSKNRALMIRYQSHKQLPLTEFDWPFQTKLNKSSRWVKLGEYIPWDGLAKAYHQNFSEKRGRLTKDARLVIGAVVIKYKLCLSALETLIFTVKELS